MLPAEHDAHEVLNRAADMHLAFSGQICLVCKFWRFVRAEVSSSAVQLNLCLEQAPLRADPEKAGFVVGERVALILVIDGAWHIPQVGPSVVRTLAVSMVDLTDRPRSGLDQPNYPMLKMAMTVGPYQAITLVANEASQRAHPDSTVRGQSPCQAPSLAVIGKQLSSASSGQIGFHWNAPHAPEQRQATQKTHGKGGVCTPCRPASLSAVTNEKARAKAGKRPVVDLGDKWLRWPASLRCPQGYEPRALLGCATPLKRKAASKGGFMIF